MIMEPQGDLRFRLPSLFAVRAQKKLPLVKKKNLSAFSTTSLKRLQRRLSLLLLSTSQVPKSKSVKLSQTQRVSFTAEDLLLFFLGFEKEKQIM